MSDFIEQVNFSEEASTPFQRRIVLGLGPKEVAEIKMVFLEISNIVTAVENHIGMSLDPEEAEDLENRSAQNDPNIFCQFLVRQVVTVEGSTWAEHKTFVFPKPGILTATDIALTVGNSVGGSTPVLATVWYSRRKEKKNERENLILSRR